MPSPLWYYFYSAEAVENQYSEEMYCTVQISVFADDVKTEQGERSTLVIAQS